MPPPPQKLAIQCSIVTCIFFNTKPKTFHYNCTSKRIIRVQTSVSLLILHFSWGFLAAWYPCTLRVHCPKNNLNLHIKPALSRLDRMQRYKSGFCFHTVYQKFCSNHDRFVFHTWESEFWDSVRHRWLYTAPFWHVQTKALLY